MLARHEGWMAQFGSVLSKDVEEKERRFVIFKANLEFIEAFNKHMGQNFTLSLNEFSDLTKKEFREIRNGYTKRSSKLIMSNYTKLQVLDMEMSVMCHLQWFGRRGCSDAYQGPRQMW